MADEMIQKIREYKPFNEQEERDREVLLRLLSGVEDVYSRENLTAHMTASAWVVNENRDKVLMAYHNIYHSWSGWADMRTESGTCWPWPCGRWGRRAALSM